MLSAALLLPGAPAVGASSTQIATSSQISSLQAQAAQLTRQMVLEQLQIDTYQQQYAAAAVRAAQDESMLATITARVTADQSRIQSDYAQLAHAAVRDYVDTGGSMAVADALFNSQTTTANRNVYEGVATGDLTAALDRLRNDRHTLAVEQGAQQALVAQDDAAQSQASTMLTDAQSTQSTLQQQGASVTGQLAQAVAQQQQLQAATAANAVAAASPGGGVPSSPGPPTSTGGAVPALPPFLQCVVRAESGGDYQAVSPTGQYMGAFQFAQGTWNYAAQLAGRPDLVGVAPDTASVADQNALAIALYSADGQQPWYDPCRTA